MIHWNAVAAGVRAVLTELSPALARGAWYLAGGTALALVEGHRVSRDLDLWTVITRHRPLDHYLDCFRRKFVRRDIGHVLRSLVYFEEAEAEPPLQMLAAVDWTTVKADPRRWVTDLLPNSTLGSRP